MKKFAVGLMMSVAFGFAQGATVSYLGNLSNGVTVFDDVPIESYSEAALWDFWRINGTAGDVVTLSVNRASNQMDPGVALYFGLGGDTAGLSAPFQLPSTSSDDSLLTFVTQDDDSGGTSPFSDGPFSNSLIASLVLPSTGIYTVAVYDVFGACDGGYSYDPDTNVSACAEGGPWTYALTADGFTDSSAVPEPESVALLAMGLLGLGMSMRRKARA